MKCPWYMKDVRACFINCQLQFENCYKKINTKLINLKQFSLDDHFIDFPFIVDRNGPTADLKSVVKKISI